MNDTRTFFNQLNQDYLRVHRTKEDLFWDTYMGMSDDHAGFAEAEQAFKAFIADPASLEAVKTHLKRLEAEPDGGEKRALQHGLEGWRALFECHILGTEEDMIFRPLEEDADRAVLRQAIRLLSPREQEIVFLRYGLEGRKELTQKEVAQEMGISQSYISRLEKRILLRLRKEFLRQTSCA